MKNNLKTIRERLGVSQAKLADLLGVSQGNISHCEKQAQEVTPDMARRLVAACKELGHDVTFDDIYDVSPTEDRRLSPPPHVMPERRAKVA